MNGGARRLAVMALAAIALAVPAGCRTGADAPVAGSSPSGSAPSPGQPTGLGGAGGETGLGGGGGEESSPAASKPSTIHSTPRPTLSTPGTVKEIDGSCPYIGAADFADLEGSRVGRVTVLQTRPVGCRFYFSYDASVMVGEITIDRFATATEAYNAMVGSANGHPEVQSNAGIGDGSVAFRTVLQGNRTWQCVFAKGTSVVTVRTRQPYPALNAFSLARAIAPKIK